MLGGGGGGGVGGGGESSLESFDSQLGVDGRRKRGPKKSASATTLTFKRGENGIEAAIRASLQGVKSGGMDKDEDDHHVTPILVSSTDEFSLSQVSETCNAVFQEMNPQRFYRLGAGLIPLFKN